MLKNNPRQYGAISKLFHWLIAFAIIGMIILGFWMHGLPVSPEKFEWYSLHKSVGALILGAAILRWLWRQINVVPKLPEDMKWHEKLGAHLGHLGLYGLMIAMPLSGWLMSSAAGFTVSVFGWFNLPNLIEPNKELVDLMKEAHEYMAFAIIGLASVHALAALYHHFIRKDTVLRRMLPWSKV